MGKPRRFRPHSHRDAIGADVPRDSMERGADAGTGTAVLADVFVAVGKSCYGGFGADEG